MARYYHRDSWGRFASGGGGLGPPSTVRTRLARGSETATIRRVDGGKVGRMARGATLTGGRFGAPINGNKNLRYVTRTNLTTRAIRSGLDLRAVGRATSARAVRSDKAPRHGYVISYSPRA